MIRGNGLHVCPLEKKYLEMCCRSKIKKAKFGKGPSLYKSAGNEHGSKLHVEARLKKKKKKSLSRVRLFATPWTVARQVPLSMGFSRQEYWSRLPFPSPEDLPEPGIEPGSLALQADALLSEPPGKQVRKGKLTITQ